MTRLATKQAAIVEANGSTRNRMVTRQATNAETNHSTRQLKRGEKRERKMRPIEVASKGNDKVVKESKVLLKEESMQVEGSPNDAKLERAIDVKIEEDMEALDNGIQSRQEEQKMLRMLSEDLALSDTCMEDDDLDATVTDSQCSGLQQSCESPSHGPEDVKSKDEHGRDNKQDISIRIPDSQSQSQNSRNESRSNCARCLRYNCSATVERRRQHLALLWLQSKIQYTNPFIPLIVEPKDDQVKVKGLSSLTKSQCDEMVRNGYRMEILPQEEKSILVKEEVKTELSEDSHIPHHLLLTGELAEKCGSSSPDVRNVTESNDDGDIIQKAMQAALNCELTGKDNLDDNVVEPTGAITVGECESVTKLSSPSEVHSSRNNSCFDGTKSTVNECKVDTSIGDTTFCTSLDDIPINAHQATPQVTSSQAVSNNKVQDKNTCYSNSGSHGNKVHNVSLCHAGSCDVGSHDAGSHDSEGELHQVKSRNAGSHDQDRCKSQQQCIVTTTTMTPFITSQPHAKRKNKETSQAVKRSCVVDLRSIKTTPSVDNASNKIIRTGKKINLGKLKDQSITANDLSLKRIIEQKNMSLDLVKLSSDQLPAKRLWPSPKSQSSSTAILSSSLATNRSNFTFNLEKVVSRAAEDFSFTTTPTGDVTSKRNSQSVFERLGDQKSPFKDLQSSTNESKSSADKGPTTPPAVEPKTPSDPPQNEEDFLELYTMDDFFDEMTDVHPPTKTTRKQPPQQQHTTTVSYVTAAPVAMVIRPSVQKCVQFVDKLPPQPFKHHQITQWVNNNRNNPPPPPPGYHTSSEGSVPGVFSFPSSPIIPTPATTPPNFDEDFDSMSVQLNVPKASNSAMEDARKLISDGNSWNRRESFTSNGMTWGGAPKGMCYRYWNTGTCIHRMANCKFIHVRNPDVSVCVRVCVCAHVHVCISVCLLYKDNVKVVM